VKLSKTKILTTLVIVILSFIIGIGLAKASIFDNFKIAFIWGIIALITIVVGIFDSIYKKRNSIIPGLVLATLTFAFIISLPIRKHYWNEKRDKCEKAIVKLDSFRKQTGNYPESLIDLKLDLDFNEINYSTDSLKQVFYISYSVDGWHSERYNSNNREWTGGD
jgi:energy-coupling factor transporter transmembrane protein EcfT